MLATETDRRSGYDRLINEASRQLVVCNACRYCEGYCAVWDAIEYRKQFEKGDVEYIANLCHDCGQCYDVCPFVPPHELSIDIPSILSDVRSQTYREYASPRIAFRFFERQSILLGLTVVISFLSLLALDFLTGNPGKLFSVITGPSSFYTILPNIVIDSAGILLTIFFVFAWMMSGWKFLSRTKRYGKIGVLDLAYAFLDSYSGKWLKGGGAGCNYPKREDKGSYLKAVMHSLIVFGFSLDLLATVAAFIEQDFVHIFPPYPIISLPVMSGLIGGILIILGVILFFILDSWEKGSKKADMKKMDRAFLTSLLMTALTGIFLLALRDTDLMGIVLLIHFSFAGALLVTAPYSKFVHLVYRYLSITIYRGEKKIFEHGE